MLPLRLLGPILHLILWQPTIFIKTRTIYGRMGQIVSNLFLSFTTVPGRQIRSGGITEMERIASIFVPTPITISHRQIGNDLQK